jgi:hypothetical protein
VLWEYNLDTGIQNEYLPADSEEIPNISIAPIGDKVIFGGWLFDWNLKPISDPGFEQIRDFWSAFWSPDGSTVIAVVVCQEEETCVGQYPNSSLIVSDSNFMSTTTIPIANNGLVLEAHWHPVEDKVLLTVYEETERGWELSPQVLSLDDMTLEPIMENLEVDAPFYFPYWLP